MTSEVRKDKLLDRLTRSLRQISSYRSQDLSTSQHSVQNTFSTFPLRDLPEELQRQCIQFCLPSEWCLRATTPYFDPSSVRPSLYQIRTVPQLPISLHLVDRRMCSQTQAVSLRGFTGELFLDSAFKNGSFLTSSDRVKDQIRSTKKLDEFSQFVTIVHMGYFNYSRGFVGFDLSLLDMLPNLHAVIAHSEHRLFEGSLYGWGDIEHLFSSLDDDRLVRFVESLSADFLPSIATMEKLWQAGIKTLLETKVNMGIGEMELSFYCVFWLRRDQEPVLLGKHLVKVWLESSRLRKSVYDKAV